MLTLTMSDEVLERSVLKTTLGKIALESTLWVSVMLLVCEKFDLVGFFATTEFTGKDGAEYVF